MTEQFFEMLWDCDHCATRGLLGQSQRHCPVCGAAQDPARRYFPEPGKEVEASGHRYAGADWRCAYCESPNGASAAFCANCGGPKDGTREVRRIADPLAGAAAAAVPVAASPVARGRMPAWRKALIALLLAIAGGAAYFMFGAHDESVSVAARSWTREIDVERFGPVSESAWCDALPAQAYQVGRTREVRSTRQVEAGQDCSTRRVDMGDGTFRTQQECRPRYRDEPVYDMKCHYRIDRWQVARSEKAQGDGLALPAWPAMHLLAAAGGGAAGSERQGGQRESYSVSLRSDDGKHWSCDVTPAVWQTLREEGRVKLKVRGIGSAVCDSLQPAP